MSQIYLMSSSIFRHPFLVFRLWKPTFIICLLATCLQGVVLAQHDTPALQLDESMDGQSFIIEDINPEIRHANSPIDPDILYPFSFDLAPNPTKGMVFVEGKTPEITNKLNITLYNLLGGQQQVNQFKQEDGRIRLDMRGLTAGVYLLRIQSKNQSLFRRLVKL